MSAEVWRVQSFDPTGARHEHQVFRGEHADLDALRYLREQVKRYEQDGWTFDSGFLEMDATKLGAHLVDEAGLERDFECELIAP